MRESETLKLTAKTYAYMGVTLVAAAGFGMFWWTHNPTGVSTPLTQTSGTNGALKPVSTLVAHPAPDTPVVRYTLVAEAKTLNLGQGKTVQAMTFNGSAPGPTLTVQQGNVVEVTVKNKLSVPITVHWHGIDVPGAEDGVPGLTQKPISPGETFVYRFIANDPGTYWYHSHVNSVQEIGAGLFGGIVVKPNHPVNPLPTRDYTVLLHEWSTSSQGQENGMSGMSGMNGMNMGNMNMSKPSLRTTGFQVTRMDWEALSEMTSAYDAFTVNQTTNATSLFKANPGDLVRLRLVNAGNMTHLMTLVDTSFKVVSLDGHDLSHPTWIQNQLLPIGAAQRYDVEFRMPASGQVQLVSADPSATERMELQATIGQSSHSSPMDTAMNLQNEPWFDFTNYGSPNSDKNSAFTLGQHYDKTFAMNLGVGMNQSGMVYTINGKAFPNTSPFVVQNGDTVKVHIENDTNYIHPMHLHGTSFQVLSRDGVPLKGSPVYLDTVEVLPGESYDIAFKATNPGLWMFHCHDLHHAAAGMDTILQYSGITDPYNVKDMSE